MPNKSTNMRTLRTAVTLPPARRGGGYPNGASLTFPVPAGRLVSVLSGGQVGRPLSLLVSLYSIRRLHQRLGDRPPTTSAAPRTGRATVGRAVDRDEGQVTDHRSGQVRSRWW